MLWEKSKPCFNLPAGQVLTDSDGQRWLLGNVFGAGGHAEVYSADIDSPNLHLQHGAFTCDQYAIKVDLAHGTLYGEVTSFGHIGRIQNIERWRRERKLKFLGMPKFISDGVNQINGTEYRFLVMERFGDDLQKFLTGNGNRFSAKTVVNLGIQLVNIVKFLHNDIKALNIVVDRKCCDQVYLIDFGLARLYAFGNYGHRKYRPPSGDAHYGTLFFLAVTRMSGHCPVAETWKSKARFTLGSHWHPLIGSSVFLLLAVIVYFFTLSTATSCVNSVNVFTLLLAYFRSHNAPRCCYFSTVTASVNTSVNLALAYNMLKWSSGKLPWEMDVVPEDKKKIFMQKRNYTDDVQKLFKECYGTTAPCPGLEQFFDYVLKLDYAEDPNYDRCRQFLKEGLRKLVSKMTETKCSCKKRKGEKLDEHWPVKRTRHSILKEPCTSTRSDYGNYATGRCEITYEASPELNSIQFNV
uniref:non-specific serine/threonine protein kinase n=1 Tax=Strigamia maritima TaxID=126957 RepID=T1JJE3_STRMM